MIESSQKANNCSRVKGVFVSYAMLATLLMVQQQQMLTTHANCHDRSKTICDYNTIQFQIRPKLHSLISCIERDRERERERERESHEREREPREREREKGGGAKRNFVKLLVKIMKKEITLKARVWWPQSGVTLTFNDQKAWSHMI